MAKNKKPTKFPKTGNAIQLDYRQSIGDDYYIDMTITLVPTTPISIFGDHMAFIWEGMYDGNIVKVILPRSTPAEFAIVEGLPNLPGLSNQITEELKRILRQLN